MHACVRTPWHAPRWYTNTNKTPPPPPNSLQKKPPSSGGADLAGRLQCRQLNNTRIPNTHFAPLMQVHQLQSINQPCLHQGQLVGSTTFLRTGQNVSCMLDSVPRTRPRNKHQCSMKTHRMWQNHPSPSSKIRLPPPSVYLGVTEENVNRKCHHAWLTDRTHTDVRASITMECWNKVLCLLSPRTKSGG